MLKIRLFGAFRDFSPDGFLTVPVKGHESVIQIKTLVGERLRLLESSFDVEALVSKSVIATDDKILNDLDQVDAAEISLLPPVCGG
jgi:hypothetical protein